MRRRAIAKLPWRRVTVLSSINPNVRPPMRMSTASSGTDAKVCIKKATALWGTPSTSGWRHENPGRRSSARANPGAGGPRRTRLGACLKISCWPNSVKRRRNSTPHLRPRHPDAVASGQHQARQGPIRSVGPIEFLGRLEAPPGVEPGNRGFAGPRTLPGDKRKWARNRAFWPVSSCSRFRVHDWKCVKMQRSERSHSQAIHTRQLDPAGGSTAFAEECGRRTGSYSPGPVSAATDLSGTSWKVGLRHGFEFPTGLAATWCPIIPLVGYASRAAA